MGAMKQEKPNIKRLASQMRRAQVVLFTGAGFSLDAKDQQGEPLPTVGGLRKELWQLCYPNEPIAEDTALGDVYQVAVRRQRKQLLDLIERRLAVDAATLPGFYELYFEMPWSRVYTLNIDDLEQAASQRFSLRRPVTSISATRASDAAVMSSRQLSSLEVVHLNGMVGQRPEELTFSEDQYAKRIANAEPWYARCAADLRSRPVVFLGTPLREIPLWQHVELRRRELEMVGRCLLLVLFSLLHR